MSCCVKPSPKFGGGVIKFKFVNWLKWMLEELGINVKTGGFTKLIITTLELYVKCRLSVRVK